MKNWTKFQLILTGVFAFAILVGVAMFAFYKGSGDVTQKVEIWSTIPRDVFESVYSTSPMFQDKTVTYNYTEKSINTFSSEYVEALASGAGPDLILVPHEVLLKEKNKLFILPFESYSQRQFQDTYLEEGEMFITPSGIIAFPFAVDPLVMYWNRDIFSSAAIAEPPRKWSEFFDLSQKITTKDAAFNITKSVAALGEFRNINNAKEIVSTLIIQAGNPVVSQIGTGYRSVIGDTMNKIAPPTQSALTFFTQFSNPAKPFYTWNRSLPSSESFFLSGDSAIYFGFASEYPTLKIKNPNLNFDIALMPQSDSGERSSTFGRVYAFGISKNTRALNGAYKIAFSLSSGKSTKDFSKALYMAPADRSSLSQVPSDDFSPVVYTSALWARGWRDPNYNETNRIFQDMIEGITSGRLRIEQAITGANNELNTILSVW